MTNTFCFLNTCTLILVFCVSGPAQQKNTDSSGKVEKFPDPAEQKIEGWTVKVDPQLLDEQKEVGDAAIKALANHLQRIKFILPAAQVKELQTLPIWLDFNYEKLKSMQYHPSKGWLLQNGHDPRLAKHVHIPRANDLVARHMWAKHPYVVLHELAHAYHDQILGFEHKEIKEAYRAAKKSGKHNEILAHNGKTVKHYGMNNHKEYFAEATEAYLGVNDFYPFVRAELKEHDPQMFEVLKKIWGPIR